MHIRYLGKKQSESNDRFNEVWNNIDRFVSKQHIDNLVDRTINEIKSTVGLKRIGYGWSGGKDSVAIKFLMDQIGVYDCVLAMTKQLEFPEFMRYATANMPDGLTIYNSGHDIKWLSQNLNMLFPKNSKIAAKWFKIVQHAGQVDFYHKKQLDIIILGRRKQDSNYVGKGTNIYYNKLQKVTRYSPISEWSHEEVLGLMRYYDLPVSPCYSWHNGWVVGSGNWAARQWTGSTQEAWREIYDIDQSIVYNASNYLTSAQFFLQNNKP